MSSGLKPWAESYSPLRGDKSSKILCSQSREMLVPRVGFQVHYLSFKQTVKTGLIPSHVAYYTYVTILAHGLLNIMPRHERGQNGLPVVFGLHCFTSKPIREYGTVYANCSPDAWSDGTKVRS